MMTKALRLLAVTWVLGVIPGAAAWAECQKPPADPRTTFPMPASAAAVLHAPFLHFAVTGAGNAATLFVYGQICAGDAARLRAYLETGPLPREISFLSPGGDLDEGLAIGRYLRTKRMTTRIAAGMVCASSCNFMFLGGTVRIIEPHGEFQVHMFAFDNAPNAANFITGLRNPKMIGDALRKDDPSFAMDDDAISRTLLNTYVKFIQQNAAQTSANIARFLVEMQLSLRFLTTFASISSDQSRVLSVDELRDFNITNVD